MSSSDAIVDAYHKYAPRWFKVIRWREWGTRIVEHQKHCFIFFYLPGALFYTTLCDNALAHVLYFKRPQTEEELLALRRNYATFNSEFQRNWQMGQYFYDVPPHYDLAERRKKYPQYYENRYDGFKKYNV